MAPPDIRPEEIAHAKRRLAFLGLLLAASFAYGFVPGWGRLALGACVLAMVVYLFIRAPRRTAKFFVGGLVGLALILALAATVLIAIGGFQPVDRIVLAVVWAIFGLLFLADRALSRGGSAAGARK